MAAESQVFANQQNEQKFGKWQSQYNKMRQIIGGKLTLIMQNKANLLKNKFNATLFTTKDYGKESAFKVRENKANQTQFPQGQDERPHI